MSMIRSSVTISLVPEARGGPFVFWDDLENACLTAKELNFDAVEIFAPNPETLKSTSIKKALADNGLALAAVGTGAGWVKHKLHLSLPNPAERKKAMDFIKGMIDAGAAHQAPAIIGSMQGGHNEEVDKPSAIGYLSDALEELGQYAEQHGVVLIFEPLNRFESNLINTMESGLHILDRLSTKNVKLLADLFHMNIEEVNIADAIRQSGPRIGHVHFVDSNRRPAGNGHIDLKLVSKALDEIQYQGYVSAEAMPWPDSESAAKTTIESFNRYFRN